MYNEIDRDTLKKKLDRDEDLHLVEVLSKQEFDRLHIQGAEHIQFKKIGEAARDRFAPEDTIVVYCFDNECKASPIAARKLDSLGYTQVFDYVGGKKDWVEAGYPLEGVEA